MIAQGMMAGTCISMCKGLTEQGLMQTLFSHDRCKLLLLGVTERSRRIGQGSLLQCQESLNAAAKSSSAG